MSKEFVPLLSICDFQGGTQPPKSEWIEEEKYGYIRMLQIRDFTQERNENEYVPISSKLKICDSDDILIARYGASIGKILTGQAGAYNVAIIKTIPDEQKILKKYLYYYLKSNVFQHFIKNVGTRAAQAGFNKQDLEALNIYLPSLEEQLQIIESLEKVEYLIDKRKEQITNLTVLKQSLFLEMFGDPVTNERKWSDIYIKDITKGIKYGLNDKADDTKSEDSLPVLRIPNIAPSKISVSNLKYVKFNKKEKAELLLEKGDLLFVRSNGNPSYIGRCAMFDLDGEYTYASYLIRVRVETELITPEFLQYQLSFPTFRRKIASESRTTAGNYNINTQSLKGIKVVCPPLDLQDHYIKLIREIDLKEMQIEESLIIIENLFSSLMQRAFNKE